MPAMRLRHAVSLTALVLAGALSACGSSTPTPSPSRTPAATATPSPTPAPPDTETIHVLATGTGTFDLVTIPVAILHNDASRHGAARVVVHFQTKFKRGGTSGALDSVPVNIGPDQTLPVTADCTDACNNANAVDVTLSVGAWVSTPGRSFAPSPGTYSCGGCAGGHQHGDVTGSIAAPLTAGTAVAVFAVCQNSQGVVLGGGLRQVTWQGGATFPLDVPVIVDARPATCTIGASTGW